MSGGKSKSQTTGFRYYMGWLMGLCYGPIDALLELRGSDRTAWTGSQEVSGQISINAPNLYGGDDKEGGLVGQLDVQMGEATQVPNDYLAAHLGANRPAYRGLLTLVYRGGQIAANNYYIKAWSIRARRILKGWAGDATWYAAKAPVPLGRPLASVDATWEYQIVPGVIDPSDPGSIVPPSSGYSSGTAPFGYVAPSGSFTPPYPVNTEWLPESSLWLRKQIYLNPGEQLTLTGYYENSAFFYVDGGYVTAVNPTNADVLPYPDTPTFSITLTAAQMGTGAHTLHIMVLDEDSGTLDLSIDNTYFYSSLMASTSHVGMNPAHIVYECLTNPEWGMGYDASIIDDASFRAAADVFYGEGLGLCMQWLRQETIENFIQLVLDHAGANLVEDRRTLLLKLIPLRGDYVVGDLPEFSDTAGNVVEVTRFERADLPDAANELTVTYKDVATGKDGSVTIQNLAAVQGAGRVISQSRSYPGLPLATLGLRTALRDLRASTSGLARTTLVVNRDGYDLTPGSVIRWSWSRDGIVDMPLRVVQIDYGSLTDGRVQIECIEDVFGLPATTFVQVQPTGWTEPDITPQASSEIAAFEAPYRELIGTLGRADTQALDAATGYVGTVAKRPAGFNLNYQLYTRTGSDDYANDGAGDWTPTGTLQSDIGPTDTALVLDGGVDLDLVDVGTTVMIGTDPASAEIGRLDAITPGTGAVTVGRGCLDTVPAPLWVAGTRVWFFDQFAAAAATEYVGGETVDAKAVTVSTQGSLDIGSAPMASVTMDQRQARPYPPGNFQINGSAYPAAASGLVTVTWSHRDRVLQDDQIIDTLNGTIGPEPGTTYTVRCYLDGVLDTTVTGVAGESASLTPGGSGTLRVELESERDGLTSWQFHTHELAYTGWGPSALTSPPKLWLSDTSAITDAGSGACSQWNDISGNGYHFTQVTSGARPTIVESAQNGRRALSFDGVNDFLGNNDAGLKAVMKNVGSGWAMVVCKKSALDGAATSRAVVAFPTNSSSSSRFYFCLSDASGANNVPQLRARRLDADAVGALPDGSGAIDTGWHIFLVVTDWANGDGFLYKDGNSPSQNLSLTSNGSTSNTDSANIAIGAAANSTNYLNGMIGEVLVGSGAIPSAAEIDKLFGYLAWRWGVVDNLPVGHPYKSAPP